jgi:hypothetical protein
MTSINEGALLMASIEELSLIIKDLESRVRVCEDEREIRELLSRYGYNADCCRDEEYVALWTDDASYDLSLIMTDSTERNETTHSWRGKDGMRDLITDPNGHQRPGFYGYSMHVSGVNLVIHIDGDDAVANSYSLLYKEEEGAIRLISAGSNEWTLRRVDGTWLIKGRTRSQTGTTSFATRLSATPG